MKRIIICFDGTWNHKEEKTPVSETNVLKMYKATAEKDDKGVVQLKWYDPGVGSRWYNKLPGGIAGVGLSKNIKQGYKQLIETYEEGDEIFIWGFSRGAYTARSLVGLVRNCGLPMKKHINQVEYAYSIYRTRDDSADTAQSIAFREKFSRNIDIKFLGVWDTVGALGIPFESFEFFNRAFYEFHDTELSGIVKNAFHAIAIDEHREIFNAALWDPKFKPDQRMEQVWFAGAHADIGGGYSTENGVMLSSITLNWMINKATDCGLFFNSVPDAPDLSGCTTVPVTNSRIGIYLLVKSIYRFIGYKSFGNESVHNSVDQLIKSKANYTPRNRVGEYILNQGSSRKGKLF